MVARLILAAALTLALGPVRDAAADSAKLVKARQAIDGVRYHDAQPLLVAALQEGGNSPAAMIELYRLSASTAIVLGQPEAAEQYYRRWLAMVPNASLPDSVAPKLREPFVAAQAYMAAHGRLAAKAQRRAADDGGELIDVVVEADPLAMIVAVVLAPEVSGGEAQPRSLGADRHARLEIARGAVAGVALIDEFGNHLVEIPATEIPAATLVPAAPVVETRDRAEPAALPLVRNPIVWAVPAVVATLVGVGFALAARRADDDVAAILARPGDHFFSDLTAAQDRRDRDALVANLGFVVGGACAITAIAMIATRPRSAPPIVAAPSTGGVVFVVSRAW